MKTLRITTVVMMLLAAGLALHHVERLAEISRRNDIRIKRLEEQVKQSEPKPFECKTASEEDIRKRCLELGKNDEYARFMVLCYRSGKTRKEIAAELNISEGTVKKYKHDRTIEMEKPPFT